MMCKSTGALSCTSCNTNTAFKLGNAAVIYRTPESSLPKQLTRCKIINPCCGLRSVTFTAWPGCMIASRARCCICCSSRQCALRDSQTTRFVIAAVPEDNAQKTHGVTVPHLQIKILISCKAGRFPTTVASGHVRLSSWMLMVCNDCRYGNAA